MTNILYVHQNAIIVTSSISLSMLILSKQEIFMVGKINIKSVLHNMFDIIKEILILFTFDKHMHHYVLYDTVLSAQPHL